MRSIIGIRPVEIRKEARIVKIFTCSCHTRCPDHKNVHAIDDKGTIYYSIDSGKFFAREALNQENIAGLFSTKSGVIATMKDGGLKQLDRKNRGDLYFDYLKAQIKEKIKESNHDLKVIDLTMSDNLAAALFNDGRVVVTGYEKDPLNWHILPRKEKKKESKLQARGSIIPASEMKNSQGDTPVKIFLEKNMREEFLVATFKNSQEFIVVNLKTMEPNTIKTDITVRQLTPSDKDFILFSENGGMYIAKNVREISQLYTYNKVLATEPLRVDEDVRSVYVKDNVGVTVLKTGAVKIYSIVNTFYYKLREAYAQGWVLRGVVQLPHRAKQVTITYSMSGSRRVNILMDNGDMVFLLVP